jgi:Neuraminidase (sialidase)
MKESDKDGDTMISCGDKSGKTWMKPMLFTSVASACEIWKESGRKELRKQRRWMREII